MKTKNQKKLILSLAMAVLILTVSVGGTLAYLSDKDSVTNTFKAAKVDCEIQEEFDKTVKNNVKIKNTGNVDAYIRASVIVTWQDDQGNIYSERPVEGTDYEISWAENGWLFSEKTEEGWYFNGFVEPEKTTDVLFTECRVRDGVVPPQGYTLHVEVLAQAIQADGMGATTATEAFKAASQGN